ncbi:Iron-sulfur clusters transporter ATM1, mitochondrial [Leucoagaricus sp. SymC.cos]|nr:Iron-sulfur clusters transporter ATM1, mitochondrial [Leucoagaricus sp. SymC.cos]
MCIFPRVDVAVDSLINFEAVKIFNDEKYEIVQHDTHLQNYGKSFTKFTTSLAFLNSSQNIIFTSALTAAMYSSRSGPRLRELNADSAAFRNLRAQFLSEWETKSDHLPGFENAYEVILTRDVRVRHDAYRCVRFMFVAARRCPEGEHIIVEGITKLIIVASRFGPGFYSYQNPARADRFSTSCTTSPYRVMIACDTVVLPGQVQEDSTGVSWQHLKNKITLIPSFIQVNEESIFTQLADGILPAYVIMYTL